MNIKRGVVFMGVCANGGVCLVNLDGDEYIYLACDNLGKWHYHTEGSLRFSEWFEYGDYILPREYLL